MKTAKEIVEITKNSSKIDADKITEIVNGIEKAAKNGEYECVVYTSYLNETELRYFIDLGFSIQNNIFTWAPTPKTYVKVKW